MSNEEKDLHNVEQGIQAADAILQGSSLRGMSTGERYEQQIEEANTLPEGPEREAARHRAWEEFARANQRAHLLEQAALRRLLNGS